jgi:hypothetical protein
MSNNRQTVLILASDPAFSREITACWPQDPDHHSAGPEFIMLDEGFSRDLQGSQYDLAIADASSVEKKSSGNKNDSNKSNNDRIKALQESLAAAGKPAIIIRSPSDPALGFYTLRGAVLELRRETGVWPSLAGVVGREILRRRHAESRAREAEKLCAAAQTEATLGRYMVDMRTNVNNVLTTVLGNAELLTLEPGLSATVLAQADAIRNMALRLHEVFQRFSSIEKELGVAARESRKKTVPAAAGRC